MRKINLLLVYNQYSNLVMRRRKPIKQQNRDEKDAQQDIRQQMLIRSLPIEVRHSRDVSGVTATKRRSLAPTGTQL